MLNLKADWNRCLRQNPNARVSKYFLFWLKLKLHASVGVASKFSVRTEQKRSSCRQWRSNDHNLRFTKGTELEKQTRGLEMFCRNELGYKLNLESSLWLLLYNILLRNEWNILSLKRSVLDDDLQAFLGLLHRKMKARHLTSRYSLYGWLCWTFIYWYLCYEFPLSFDSRTLLCLTPFTIQHKLRLSDTYLWWYLMVNVHKCRLRLTLTIDNTF